MSRLMIGLCLTALAVLAPGLANTADTTAKDFVSGLYRSYVGKDAPGLLVDTPRFKAAVTPGLWRLIEADSNRAARRSEVPDLDGDPFVDAQDWDIKAVGVEIEERGKDKAQATVSFTNFDKPVTVRLALVRMNGAWKIDDVMGPRRKSIRALLGGKKR